MSDIVERIRALHFVHVPVASALFEEACQEIERLRQDLSQKNLTDAEREALLAMACHCDTRCGSEWVKLSATLRALLSRTGTSSRQTGDNAAECHSHGVKCPERERLTDAERRGMDTDNTQGVNEPSPASAGSQPFAWAVTPTGKDGEIDCEFVYPCEATAGDVALGCNGVVVPLYRQSTLTDEEREAVEACVDWCDGVASPTQSERAATLRALLERTK